MHFIMKMLLLHGSLSYVPNNCIMLEKKEHVLELHMVKKHASAL